MVTNVTIELFSWKDGFNDFLSGTIESDKLFSSGELLVLIVWLEALETKITIENQRRKKSVLFKP